MARRKLDVNGDIVLTEKQRQALILSAEKHTLAVNAARVTYPDPGEQLTLDKIKALGFVGAHDSLMLVRDDDDAEGGLEYRGGRRRQRGKNRDRKQGGGKQGGGKQGGSQQGSSSGSKGGGGSRGGGGKSLADPNMVADEVLRPLKDIPLAGMDDEDLALGEQNWENLDPTKANYFKKAIGHIVTRHHVMFCIEVSPEGLQVMANNNPGYTSYVSQANNRQQAVGFLVHKRLKVLKVTEYSNVANVFGIPDLRSAYRLDLEDTKTGLKFSVVVVHLKSMRGGEPKTAPVRTQQCKELVKSLGSGLSVALPAYGKLQVFPWFKNPKLGRSLTDHALLRIILRLNKGTCTEGELILIAGDWNSKLDTAKDLQPLYDALWHLANPNDKTGTQTMGPSRLDGFVGNGENDKACGHKAGDDPHGPFSNDPSGSPEVDVNA